MSSDCSNSSYCDHLESKPANVEDLSHFVLSLSVTPFLLAKNPSNELKLQTKWPTAQAPAQVKSQVWEVRLGSWEMGRIREEGEGHGGCGVRGERFGRT